MKLDNVFGREILANYAFRSGALEATLSQLIDTLEIARIKPRGADFTAQCFDRALNDAKQLLAHLSAHDEARNAAAWDAERRKA